MGGFTPSRQSVPGTTSAGTRASDRHDFTGSIIVSGSGFVNFGQVSGSGGYGFRSDDGTLQFKNAGGSWDTFGSSAGAVTAYTNTGNDRIITSTGGTGINGEANLTFDGSTLVVAGGLSASVNISASAYYGDGSTLSDVTADPAGSDTQLQYNNGGSMGAASDLSYDDATGYLGVGTTGGDITHRITLPNTAGAAGRIKANRFTTYSSVRYKENIETLSSPLEVVKQLRGVSFNWKNNGPSDIGFIAEEAGKVIPEIVDWDASGHNAESMDYTRVVPYLLEAMKVQQKQIDSLKFEIILLKNDKK